MNFSLITVGGVFKTLQAGLIAYGAVGLFLIALMDAALIPLPGGPDVVVMALAHHSNSMTPLYVLAAVAGSTLGSLILYSIARAGGEAALRRFSPEKRARAMRMVEKYDFWALLLAAVLPPPFPFKLFVLSAGAFRMKIWRFVSALIIGRGFRFILEGLAAVYYGEMAADMIKQHYPKIGLGIAAAIVAIFLGNLLRSRRRDAEIEDGQTSSANRQTI
ncbi:MAG: DedA family protein [Acidobacteria bacterium]|nr:DedA family protein [Acidobacteriota bacterium]MCW5969441.1 DedA family protein [Blastocatellales bacterium]